MNNSGLSSAKKMLRQFSEFEILPDFRKETLLLFDHYFGLDRSIFWLCDDRGDIYNPVTRNINKETLQTYTGKYRNEDFLLPAYVTAHLSTARVLAIQDVVSSSEYENSLFFNEFMKPNHYYHEMGIYLMNKNKLIGGISFVGERNHAFFNTTAIESIELISYFISMKLQDVLKKNEKLSQLKGLNLTPSEEEICKLLQKGLTNLQIANHLFVSINTVKKHLQNIYQKNKVTSRTSLLALFHSGNYIHHDL